MTTLWILAAATLAAPPNELDLQGALRNAGGAGVDGTYAITVTLYDAPSDGQALLTRSFVAVPVTGGAFSVVVDGVTPDLVAAHDALFAGVKVEGEPELPRQRVRPVAAALVATRALGLACTGCVTAEMLAPGTTPAAGAGLTLTDGALSLDVAYADARYVNTDGDVLTGSLGVLGDLDVKGTLTCGTLALPQATLATLPAAGPGNVGQLYFATDRGRLVFSDGIRWVEVGEQPPLVLSATPSQVAPGQAVTVTLLGSGFAAGAKVAFGEAKSPSVTVVSGSEIAAEVPAGLASGSYDIVVTNLSGLQGSLPKGLTVDAAPVWVTAAGSLGQVPDKGAVSLTLAATDPEDGYVTYAIVSGALPPGLALDSATGEIGGDPTDVAAPTTSMFTVRATDTAPQPIGIDREFSLTITLALDGSNASRAAASCEAILSAGFSSTSGAFWLAPAAGSSFQIWCDMTTEGGGWIDIVRTMNLPGIDVAETLARFFVTNNDYAIQAGVGAETTTAAPGFYVINTIPTYNHNEGCHFQSPFPYGSVRLAYRMQGNDEGYRCSSGNWIPLHGPGFDGGYDGYFSPCPAGKTCIQGRPENLRDAPIAASYESDAIDSATTLLTFSGSGVGSSQVGGCARDAAIPVANPCTFFTKLLVK